MAVLIDTARAGSRRLHLDTAGLDLTELRMQSCLVDVLWSQYSLCKLDMMLHREGDWTLVVGWRGDRGGGGTQ